MGIAELNQMIEWQNREMTAAPYKKDFEEKMDKSCVQCIHKRNAINEK